MQLLAITGRKFAGKDSLARPLIEELGWKQVRYADPLKDMLRALFRAAGVDPDSIERMIEGDMKEEPTRLLNGNTPRLAMQLLGTEWRDMIGGPGMWLTIAENRIDKLRQLGTKGVVVTDMRFAHEAEQMARLGATRVRVIGLGDPNESSAHISEQQIDDLPVDTEVFNFSDLKRLRMTSLELARSCNNINKH